MSLNNEKQILKCVESNTHYTVLILKFTHEEKSIAIGKKEKNLREKLIILIFLNFTFFTSTQKFSIMVVLFCYAVVVCSFALCTWIVVYISFWLLIWYFASFSFFPFPSLHFSGYFVIQENKFGTYFTCIEFVIV